MPTHPADEATLRVSADHTPRAPGDLAQFAPGTLIAGRYRIVSLLGSGGMGEVYRADDIKLGQTVALKFLPAALARDPILLGRLHDEVRLGRQVSHPNVCRIYDIGEFGHAHFVAMEYVDGEDLARLLRRIGRLSHDKGVELAHGIAAGLAAAHAKGILHRDLKPANVMIDSHGNPRITDFGLALDAEDSGFNDSAGTPAYMAPEQLDGRPASAQSDLYALGLVMYEMFTGRRPYSGRSVAELRDVISTEDTKPPSSHVREIDPAVERIILRCLSRDPAQRPRSAREVLEALPGGDPLAAALAAGETPSPRLVAAAGAEGSLRPAVAWAWLGIVAALLTGALLIAQRWRVVARIPFEMSPAVLEQRAADIAAELGLPRAAYRVSDMRGNQHYLSWVAENDRSPLRFADLRRGPAAVTFHVRLGGAPLTPVGQRTAATPEDPPLAKAGDALITLDTSGRLLALSAVPPATGGGKAADWNRLFSFAKFDPNALRRVPPRAVPPHYADERAAWDGTWPDMPSRPVHIEAAASGGTPVWFRVSGPWDTAGADQRMPFSGRNVVVFFFAVSAAAALLAILLLWRNIRLRRGDRSGAFRLAVGTAILTAAGMLLGADYSGGIGHLARIAFVALQSAVTSAVIVYAAYIALEPYIRRRSPERLIAWTRLLAGNVRDPLVGRHVLIGIAAGSAHLLLAMLTNWLPGVAGWVPPHPPQSWNLDVLLGLRRMVGELLGDVVGSVLFALIPMLLLVGLTIVLRRRSFAAAGLFAIHLLLYVVAAQGNPYFIVTCIPISLVQTAVAVRLGMLATVVGHFVFITLFHLPALANFSSWAAPTMLAPIVVVAALAVYAFRVSLGNQPAFSGSLIDD
jgi:Protein kinase domain